MKVAVLKNGETVRVLRQENKTVHVENEEGVKSAISIDDVVKIIEIALTLKDFFVSLINKVKQWRKRKL